LRFIGWGPYIGDIEVHFERLYLTNAGPVTRSMGWKFLRKRDPKAGGFFPGPHVTPASDAHVTNIDLRCGSAIDQLKVRFNDQIIAQFGGGGGGPHSVEMSGSCLTGFYCHSHQGEALRSLGFICQRFLPLHWVPSMVPS
jgi:hypothetical protein